MLLKSVNEGLALSAIGDIFFRDLFKQFIHTPRRGNPPFNFPHVSYVLPLQYLVGNSETKHSDYILNKHIIFFLLYSLAHGRLTIHTSRSPSHIKSEVHCQDPFLTLRGRDLLCAFTLFKSKFGKHMCPVLQVHVHESPAVQSENSNHKNLCFLLLQVLGNVFFRLSLEMTASQPKYLIKIHVSYL